MSFFELAEQRYSERHFDPRAVERDKLQKILEAGRLAPTGCNYQPQRIYVIQSGEAMKKAVESGASLCGCPVAMLVCYDINEVWKNPRDRYFENYNCGEQDCSIVAANMMYEAQELGLRSLWIRGFDALDIIELFDLPENHIPVMILALGYPSETSRPAHLHGKRKELSETVKFI